MKQLIITILFLLVLVPCKAYEVKVKQQTTNQQGRPRMPSATKVGVNIEDESISTCISGFYGTVNISIHGLAGAVFNSESAIISGEGTIEMDASYLPNGVYTIRITLEDTVYEGTFII